MNISRATVILTFKIRKIRTLFLSEKGSDFSYLVRVTGVEPAHLAAQEPKSCVSANSTIPAYMYGLLYHK